MRYDQYRQWGMRRSWWLSETNQLVQSDKVVCASCRNGFKEWPRSFCETPALHKKEEENRMTYGQHRQFEMRRSWWLDEKPQETKKYAQEPCKEYCENNPECDGGPWCGCKCHDPH